MRRLIALMLAGLVTLALAPALAGCGDDLPDLGAPDDGSGGAGAEVTPPCPFTAEQVSGFVGLTMGGWFFATAVGNKFSGFLGVLQGALAPATFFLVIAAAVALVAVYIKMVLPRLDAAIKKYGA